MAFSYKTLESFDDGEEFDLLDDEKPEKKKTRGRPSSMIQLNAVSILFLFKLVFESNLADVFPQLDALPNTNHSESVVGAFTCHWHEGQSGGTGNGHTQNGVFYVPPAQEPVQRHWQRSRSNVFTCATGTSPSQKVESKEVTETTAQPLKEIAKETKKSSHADDLLNLSSPGESSANNANLLDDFLGSSGASTANAAPAAPINAVQSQTSGQTPTNTANSSQQAFQQNGAFDDSLFTSASSDAKSGNDKTTKESIMALYGSSTPQQQNIFGVPVASPIVGGAYSQVPSFFSGQQMFSQPGMAPQGSMFLAQQPNTEPVNQYKLFTDTTTPGGMYMPAQGINVQPTMPANNSMAVQQGMTGMVNPGLVGMPQPGLYQLNATGMMATAPGSNSMPAAAGMMMQPPQMGMYAATQAQPQMNQMNMQQMQHQLAAMRLNTSNVIPPTGQMGVRPPVGAPANQASNPWGMQPTSGQTLSTNLWQ
uniref:Stromal membrane-associated protein 1 n=1 Tax=Octopus bimaculoides TaxID=37653 RepID=A0A0L8ICQ9_OCTBM